MAEDDEPKNQTNVNDGNIERIENVMKDLWTVVQSPNATEKNRIPTAQYYSDALPALNCIQTLELPTGEIWKQCVYIHCSGHAVMPITPTFKSRTMTENKNLASNRRYQPRTENMPPICFSQSNILVQRTIRSECKQPRLKSWEKAKGRRSCLSNCER